MSPIPTPRSILETLLPHLKSAAAYARQLQPHIAARPEKQQQANFFAAALSDADLSIQTLVEVALLGAFPEIRFFGEEHEQSYNTKYFRSIALGEPGDYLVTLDPVDGTQFYLDGHSNYQIILTVLNADEFEAVLAISPGRDRYYYSLRGEGTFWGPLEAQLHQCQRLQVRDPKPGIYLGVGMSQLVESLRDRFDPIDLESVYSSEVEVPNFNGILTGDLAGAVVKSAQFIDGAAIAFMAQEMGCIVTTYDGSPPPPLNQCQNYRRPGLIVANSEETYRFLREVVQSVGLA